MKKYLLKYNGEVWNMLNALKYGCHIFYSGAQNSDFFIE